MTDQTVTLPGQYVEQLDEWIARRVETGEFPADTDQAAQRGRLIGMILDHRKVRELLAKGLRE